MRRRKVKPLAVAVFDPKDQNEIRETIRYWNDLGYTFLGKKKVRGGSASLGSTLLFQPPDGVIVKAASSC